MLIKRYNIFWKPQGDYSKAINCDLSHYDHLDSKLIPQRIEPLRMY